ncbi:MAG TPA: hypothetical protein VGD61_16220 [Pyrinomonadaceae bacterium]
MCRFIGKLLTSLLIALLALPTILLASQSKDDSDPLKPYTTCEMGGDLKVKDITRRPKSAEKYREVTTDKGNERVSVVNGYRVMFGYEDVRYYFANVKIEQSDAESYAQDKERVINELKHYSSTKQATKIQYHDKQVLNGFEHYGIDRDVIDVGGQVGIHVLFGDTKHLIITIYFLNQEKKNRRFNSIEGYFALQTDFLNRYTECLSVAANR